MPTPDDQVLREQLRAQVHPQNEAELDAWFALAQATFIIPEAGPRDGVEWAQLAFTRSDQIGGAEIAWGEMQWSFDSSKGILLAHVSVPDRDFAMVLTLAENATTVTGYGNHFSLEASITGPWGESALRRVYGVFAGSRLVMGNPQIADGMTAGPGQIEAELTSIGMDAAKSSDTIGLSFLYQDGQELTVTLAFGKTGREALGEAFQLWESPPFDLATARADTEEPPPDGNAIAYLYIEEPDGLIRHALPVSWSLDDGSSGPRVVASVDLPARETPLTLAVWRSDEAQWIVVSSLTREEDDPYFVRLRLKPDAITAGEPFLAPELSVRGDLSFRLSLDDIDRSNFDRFQEWDWFEVEMAYPDGHVELLVFDKGETGRAVFDQAFAAWGLTPTSAE